MGGEKQEIWNVKIGIRVAREPREYSGALVRRLNKPNY